MIHLSQMEMDAVNSVKQRIIGHVQEVRLLQETTVQRYVETQFHIVQTQPNEMMEVQHLEMDEMLPVMLKQDGSDQLFLEMDPVYVLLYAETVLPPLQNNVMMEMKTQVMGAMLHATLRQDMNELTLLE